MSALNAKVPDYVWAEVINLNICMHRLAAPPDTFTIKLLSDMEFLSFQGSRSSRGMTWEDPI